MLLFLKLVEETEDYQYFDRYIPTEYSSKEKLLVDFQEAMEATASEYISFYQKHYQWKKSLDNYVWETAVESRKKAERKFRSNFKEPKEPNTKFVFLNLEFDVKSLISVNGGQVDCSLPDVLTLEEFAKIQGGFLKERNTPTIRRPVEIKESTFGDYVDYDTNADCVIVCYNNGTGWIPWRFLLPHQIYTKDIEELRAKKEVNDIGIFEVNPHDFFHIPLNRSMWGDEPIM